MASSYSYVLEPRGLGVVGPLNIHPKEQTWRLEEDSSTFIGLL